MDAIRNKKFGLGQRNYRHKGYRLSGKSFTFIHVIDVCLHYKNDTKKGGVTATLSITLSDNSDLVYLIMETLRIDIVNPKAKKIIKELADLNLISIRNNDPIKSFQKLISKLRNKAKKVSLGEITNEVELVRAKRYGKKD